MNHIPYRVPTPRRDPRSLINGRPLTRLPQGIMAGDNVNRAAWQREKKGPFTVEDAELWEPGENEIRIKVPLLAPTCL